MKRFLTCIVFVFALFLSACGFHENDVIVGRENQFIVGLECNYAPFNWTESQATPYNHPIANAAGRYADGYDVQIAKALAACLGKVLVIEKLEWEALIPSLESGKIDAIIAGMSPTPSRALSVNFSEAYYRSTHVMLLKKESPYAGASSIHDFAGADIVGQHGTIYDDLIEQLTGARHATPLKNIPDILTAILANKYDGTILELPVAKAIVSGNPEFIYRELTPGFEVSDEDVCVAVAVRLHEDALTLRINNILSAIPDDVRSNLMDEAAARNNGVGE